MTPSTLRARHETSRSAITLATLALFAACSVTPNKISLLPSQSDEAGGGSTAVSPEGGSGGSVSMRDASLSSGDSGGGSRPSVIIKDAGKKDLDRDGDDDDDYDGGDACVGDGSLDGGGSCGWAGDCAVPTPLCDVATHTCVACLSNSDCPTHLCNVALHTCKTCYYDRDCPGNTPYCDVDEGVCAECTPAAPCPTPQVCVAAAHACAARCQTAADCAGSDRSICPVASGVCVECQGDSDCSGGLLSRCDVSLGTCFQCLSDADCPGGHCHVDGHRCVD